MQVARENLDTAIQQLLNYTPNHLPQNPDNLACDPVIVPFAFYDFHVDDQLSLKRVAPFPSFPANLAKVVDRAMDKIKSDGVVFPTSGSHVLLRSSMNIKHVDDGKAVSEVYKSVIADHINPVASMFSLHPHAPWWTSSLKFTQCELSHTRYPKNYSMHENAGLSFRVNPDDKSSLPARAAWDTMEESRRELLEKAARLFPQLAVFQFYCEGDKRSEQGLRDIDNHISQPFNPKSYTSAPGCRPAKTGALVPPDAMKTAWGDPVVSLNTECRRSSRIAARERKCKTRPQWIKVTLPQASPHIKKDNPQDFSKSMLLHAWTRAVEVDATFIVINCANHERIGYRHRESQTLFISEVIDVPKCADPSYTKLHLGLYLSIIEDTLERTCHIMERESLLAQQSCQPEIEIVRLEESCKLKRKRSDEDVLADAPRKRHQTRAASTRESVRRLDACRVLEEIDEEIQGRRLALLRVEYLHYNSLTPSSFWENSKPDSRPRPKKSDYIRGPQDYFVVTLISALCDGSTGHAHRATLELLGRDGKPRTYSNIVVKLATESKAIARLQNEYKVYEHLQASGVKGIPRVFGIYHDHEVKATILVMSDVGKALWQRPLLKSGIMQVSPEEREGFIEVLKSIHAAGVRHRDIRIMNMAVEDDGTVSIFDFDMADVAASEASREREMAHLINLLDGKELPWEPQLTLGTPDNCRPYDANDAFDYVEVEGVTYEEAVLVRTQSRR